MWVVIGSVRSIPVGVAVNDRELALSLTGSNTNKIQTRYTLLNTVELCRSLLQQLRLKTGTKLCYVIKIVVMGTGGLLNVPPVHSPHTHKVTNHCSSAAVKLFWNLPCKASKLLRPFNPLSSTPGICLFVSGGRIYTG